MESPPDGSRSYSPASPSYRQKLLDSMVLTPDQPSPSGSVHPRLARIGIAYVNSGRGVVVAEPCLAAGLPPRRPITLPYLADLLPQLPDLADLLTHLADLFPHLASLLLLQLDGRFPTPILTGLLRGPFPHLA